MNPDVPGHAVAFDVDGGSIELPLEAVIVAGFTGRDPAEVRMHVEELGRQGVSPPADVPSFYVLPASALQQTGELTAVHDHTSGEAEPVLLIDGDATFVTLASDHTDRRAEAMDIGLAKMACAKIAARTAWRLDEVAGHWDDLRLGSWLGVAREPYQAGALASLLRPGTLLERIPFAHAPSCFALLMGTVPVAGAIRSSDRFHAELHDPVLERTIELSYDVRVLDLMKPA